MTFDPQQFRHTMRLWATGVTVVSSEYEGSKRGTTVSSFTSVTLEPPLILVCLQKVTETAEIILQSRNFAVSMLGEDQEMLSNLFAGFVEMAPEANRFDHIETITADTGAPIIKGAMGWLDCELHQVYDGSTHHIFIGKVVAASGQSEPVQMPLIYYNREYRRIE